MIEHNGAIFTEGKLTIYYLLSTHPVPGGGAPRCQARVAGRCRGGWARAWPTAARRGGSPARTHLNTITFLLSILEANYQL